MSSDLKPDQNKTSVLHAVLSRFGHARGHSGNAPRGRPAGFLSFLIPSGAPFELQILGRTLLHAALVGVGAGLIGAGFFAALELLQSAVLERLGGYEPLRAFGEKFVAAEAPTSFRPWLLVFLPALGALLGGLASRLAPETRGGGGDAMIEAFHHHGGVVRRRVIGVKALTSILTLGFGGSGGREGPTMQIGAALGSTVGRWLRVGTVERRVLMIAGVAAGMSAVFRTPLGAALLAVEVLYRDDFEGEALIPAILASVIAYSVVILIFGESTLFARAPRYPFIPVHLPLYALLALLIAVLASLFVKSLRTAQRLSARIPAPAWVRPAVGGLGLGVMTVLIIIVLGPLIHHGGRGLGILGGGYGAAQAAITGAAWLPTGWTAVELLLFLCAAKLVASGLTIGTGGSAGDFAPSLVLGALFGGAFGRAAQLLLHDPTIDSGAFALVGMGCFYGGVAHVPVSSLILVSELAGSYDLLVPLMLAEGIAFVALRRVSLYHAQPPTRRESPVHKASAALELLMSVPVGEIIIRDRPFLQFAPATPTREIANLIADATWQDTFPIVDAAGTLCGIVTVDALRHLAHTREAEAITVASDIAQPVVAVSETDDLRAAAEAMLANKLREIPVLDAQGRIVGFLDEADVSRAYVQASSQRTAGAPPPKGPPGSSPPVDLRSPSNDS